MVCTNFSVPKYGDSERMAETYALSARADYWEKHAKHLEREISQLFQSIEENGYATLTDGKTTLSLVKEEE